MVWLPDAVYCAMYLSAVFRIAGSENNLRSLNIYLYISNLITWLEADCNIYLHNVPNEITNQITDLLQIHSSNKGSDY